MSLSQEELHRYSRQIRFAQIGVAGQERLRAARVAIIGCGALGSTVAEILVRSGVGFVRLVDRDFVDQSNLPRQSLFDERDVTLVLPKAVAAARHLRQLNSAVAFEPLVTQVSAANVEELIAGVDLVLDGTDNFPTRFLLNDAAAKRRQPWIFGAALGSRGLMMVVRPGLTPCLRCLMAELPAPGQIPTCDAVGVLATTVHVTSALESAEAVKFLTGHLADLEPRLIDFDLWAGRFSQRGVANLRGHGLCPACELQRYDYLDSGLEPPAVLAGRDGVQVTPAALPPNAAAAAATPGATGLDLPALAARLRRGWPTADGFILNEFLLRFRDGPLTVTIFADGRAIIQGLTDPEAGRKLYERYVAAC